MASVIHAALTDFYLSPCCLITRIHDRFMCSLNVLKICLMGPALLSPGTDFSLAYKCNCRFCWLQQFTGVIQGSNQGHGPTLLSGGYVRKGEL